MVERPTDRQRRARWPIHPSIRHRQPVPGRRIRIDLRDERARDVRPSAHRGDPLRRTPRRRLHQRDAGATHVHPMRRGHQLRVRRGALRTVGDQLRHTGSAPPRAHPGSRLLAATYAATVSAGIRPRAATLYPFALAYWRICLMSVRLDVVVAGLVVRRPPTRVPYLM